CALPLHDALPICWRWGRVRAPPPRDWLNSPPNRSEKPPAPPPPPAAAPPKMSPRSKSPPVVGYVVPPGEPKPPNPPEETWARNSSHSLRLAASPMTLLASLLRLNLSSAAVSPGFEAGWFSRASLRYALRISSCDAFLETPSSA